MGERGGSAKRAEWRKRLRKYRGSGLTVAGFCEQEGISTASFYAWRKRLRGTIKAARDGRAGFASVRLTPAGTPMAIHLPGGVRVEVPMENLEATRAVVGEVLAGAVGPDGKDASC